MKPTIAFFGQADFGKSTIMGYLYANSLDLDMDKHEIKLLRELGSEYKPDYLYPSIINRDIFKSMTVERIETRQIENANSLVEGKRVIENTADKLIVEETYIYRAGDKHFAKIVTTEHKRGMFKGRFNTVVHKPINVKIENCGKFTMIDTPGHIEFVDQRERGVRMGNIGVFVLPINEVLNDNFETSFFDTYDLWWRHNKNTKLIYALTKFDLEDFQKEAYETACKKIQMCFEQVYVKYYDDLNGIYFIPESDAFAIVPIAVIPECREAINLLAHSEKTPWYKGATLIDAIQEQIYDLPQSEYGNKMLFSINKEFSKIRTGKTSKSEKVWRIRIESGTLKVGDRITLTSVNVTGYSPDEYLTVTATVKTIREDLDAFELSAMTQEAHQGSIVSVDLSDCSIWGNKKISKNDITVSKQTIGLLSDETISYVNSFFIDFNDTVVDMKEMFSIIDTGREIRLSWYGNNIAANVTEISGTGDGIRVTLIDGKTIAIPNNPEFKQTNVFGDVTISTIHKGIYRYFPGCINDSRCFDADVSETEKNC